MKNADPRVDAYIERAAGFAKPILRRLRGLVHAGCPDVVETMKWGSPSFLHAGKILGGMAAFKEHCTFGFWHKAMESVLGKAGAKAGTAMGSFGRITSVADLPPDARFVRWVRKAAELNESGAPGRPRPARRPAEPVRVPPDLAAALKRNRVAAETFDRFSPSHRREYVEWITEAKRDETRRQRLATTLEWLAEGKARNWKYEKC